LLTHCLVDAPCGSVASTRLACGEVPLEGPIPRGQGLLRTPHRPLADYP